MKSQEMIVTNVSSDICFKIYWMLGVKKKVIYGGSQSHVKSKQHFTMRKSIPLAFHNVNQIVGKINCVMQQDVRCVANNSIHLIIRKGAVKINVFQSLCRCTIS